MKKLNIKNIIVPVDFSKSSTAVIKAANKIAQRFNATVHLVHVFDAYYLPISLSAVPVAAPIGPADWSVGNIAAELKAARSRNLSKLATQFGVSQANCHLRDGIPIFDEICRTAHEIGADLIIMPTHGHTGLKRVFLGSTAERVIQHSPCPVLVYRKDTTRIDRILVPVDFSVCSREALQAAIAFADRVAARIVVIHAVHVSLAFATDKYAMYNVTTLIKAEEKRAQEAMQAFVRQVKFGGVKFDTVVKVGPPITEITRFAQANNIDLIITGTHGRTGLGHLLIGSVAEQIARYAPSSVLVIPSHPSERIKRIARPARKSRDASRLMPKRIPVETEKFRKRFRKIEKHASPERRQTNKFREARRSVNP